jgi:hypothetical protein
MAALNFSLVTAEVALAAATAKTVVQVTAPTNQRVKLKGWSVSFDGTSATAAPVVCRLLRQTTAGTMTSLTPRKGDDDIATAIQSTGQHTATAEPTAGDILDTKEVHPQGGYSEKFGLGDEIIIGGGDRIGIECTAPATVNVVGSLHCEE